MGKINRVFPSITFMFQSISFSFDPRGPCQLKQSFRRQLNWAVSLPLSKFWHNSLSSVQKPRPKWKGNGAMPRQVSATTHQALTLAQKGVSSQIPWVAILCPSHTRHYNCITEFQALLWWPGDGAKTQWACSHKAIVKASLSQQWVSTLAYG